MVMCDLECYGWDCQWFESELHRPFHCYLRFKRNEFCGAVYTEVTGNSHTLFPPPPTEGAITETTQNGL